MNQTINILIEQYNLLYISDLNIGERYETQRQTNFFAKSGDDSFFVFFRRGQFF